EADTPTGFDRGMRGLAVRVAKAVNRALRRHGRVWADRFHARLLKTPREVRNTLVYVLNNLKKHVARVRGMDPCSSARWFDCWEVFVVAGSSPLPRARTWLAAVGWRRRGLIHLEEMPHRPSG